MARQHKQKKSNSKPLRELRFSPDSTQTTLRAAAPGFLGSLALGAGVYANWIADTPSPLGWWLTVGGAVALLVAFWQTNVGLHPIRVGNLGIAVESGAEVLRIHWCDIRKLELDARQLRVSSGDTAFSVPVAPARSAISYIVREARRRVPDRVRLVEAVLDSLPAAKEADGELVTPDGVQLVGRHCAASGAPITFEREARICPHCGQVYLDKQVPGRCKSCGNELGDRAQRVA